jgi:DNA processing protein
MARGIDTAAHKGALSAGGYTVAVLGCGADLVYPAENRKLASEIIDKGLLLSEFPMGTAAFPQNFPVRNRVVSGLSAGILVVEGAQYSGSSITAKLAIDQNREVFAVPGNVTSKMSWGPNLLIKEGAKLVQDWNDVVVDLPVEVRRRLIDEGKRRLGVETPPPDQTSLFTGPSGPAARAVLGNLKVDAATHLDQLIETMEDTSRSEIVAALFELEMMGLARQLPGNNFVKVW